MRIALFPRKQVIDSNDKAVVRNQHALAFFFP